MQYLLFIAYALQSAVNPHIWHSVVLYCREPGWRSWLKSTKRLCSVKTNSHVLPGIAVQILLKSLEQCNYDATRFSWPHRPAVLSDFLCWLLFFEQRWIKSHLGDFNYTYEKHLSVVESAFTFSFSPISQLSQYHRPRARSKFSNSLQCKNAPISSSQVRSRR